jgi:hypothetical protein
MSSFGNDNEALPAKWRLACHVPYSPDLAPANSSVFAEVKTALIGRLFQDFEDKT